MCVSADGKYSHSGACVGDENGNTSNSYYLDDNTVNGILANSNSSVDTTQLVLQSGTQWDEYLAQPNIMYGDNTPLKREGWTARKDKFQGRGNQGVKEEHIHVKSPNGDIYVQKDTGEPSHKNKALSDPPNWVKKELQKKFGWDWDGKANDWYEKQLQNTPSTQNIIPVVPGPIPMPEMPIPEIPFPEFPIPEFIPIF